MHHIVPHPRLLARFRQGPIFELWRAKHPGGSISENGILALTAGMSPEWTCWVERPSRDCDTFGRMARFDQTPTDEPDPAEDLIDEQPAELADAAQP